MPKLITTRTRTSDLGNPGMISIGEGDCREEVMNNRKIKFAVFDCLSCPRPLSIFYSLPSAYISFSKEIKYNYGNGLPLKWQFF